MTLVLDVRDESQEFNGQWIGQEINANERSREGWTGDRGVALILVH